MGLLDEAIREHLELKRRRGADPGAVAREERQVLEPAVGDDNGTPQGEVADADDGAPAGGLVDEEPQNGDAPHYDGEPAAGATSVGQETAELDMQAVIDEDAAAQPADWGIDLQLDGESSSPA
jgi:hypothetical protein